MTLMIRTQENFTFIHKFYVYNAMRQAPTADNQLLVGLTTPSLQQHVCYIKKFSLCGSRYRILSLFNRRIMLLLSFLHKIIITQQIFHNYYKKFTMQLQNEAVVLKITFKGSGQVTERACPPPITIPYDLRFPQTVKGVVIGLRIMNKCKRILVPVLDKISFEITNQFINTFVIDELHKLELTNLN